MSALVTDRAGLVDLARDCQRRAKKMNDWERDFVANVSNLLGRGRKLSEAQVERLNATWDKVTADG